MSADLRKDEKAGGGRTQSHYDVLGIAPGAGPSEIRLAFEHLSAVFDPDSLALYSLTEPEEQKRALAEVREAHRVLSDPGLRQAYDEEMGFQAARVEPTQQVLALGAQEEAPGWPSTWSAPADATSTEPGRGGEGVATPEEPIAEEEVIQLGEADLLEVLEPAPDPEHPALPPIDASTEFDGPLLQAVREARGLTRRQVWERTRIGVNHIQNIEEENFGALPSRVFLRGFLQSLAKEFGLDPARVSETYLRRREG